MGSIGFPEMVVILIVALLVFGPGKLPEIGSSLGRGISEFKKGIREGSKPTPEKPPDADQEGNHN
jgi:sec-independent protein translocase protein TatA